MTCACATRTSARAYLISTRNQNSIKSLFASLALLIAVIPFAAAQAPLASNPVAGSIAAGTRLDIPDSPGFLFGSSSSSAHPDSASFDSAPKVIFKHSPHLQMIILPDEIADPMTAHDKVVGWPQKLGVLRDRIARSCGMGAADRWQSQLWNRFRRLWSTARRRGYTRHLKQSLQPFCVRSDIS